MKCLDLTLPTPAENLACDEALLDLCEEGGIGTLRFWESQEHFVVVGYANRIEAEVNRPACEAAGVPILRRCSGGGTVLQGPGCLNYSLALPFDDTGPLATIQGTNQFIMERHRLALENLLGRRVKIQGHTDLAVDDRKFSGNAQRRKRCALIFHGTFLHAFDLPLIEKFLRFPSLQPDYRHDRPHTDFVTNLEIDPAQLRSALRAIWNAEETLAAPPMEKIAALLREKYSRVEWNGKF